MTFIWSGFLVTKNVLIKKWLKRKKTGKSGKKHNLLSLVLIYLIVHQFLLIYWPDKNAFLSKKKTTTKQIHIHWKLLGIKSPFNYKKFAFPLLLCSLKDLILTFIWRGFLVTKKTSLPLLAVAIRNPNFFLKNKSRNTQGNITF